MENKYIEKSDTGKMTIPALVATVVVIGVCLMFSQTMKSRELHQDVSGPIVYSELVPEQLELYSMFKRKRDLMPATLEDNREGFVSPVTGQWFSEKPKDWFHPNGDPVLDSTEQAMLAAFAHKHVDLPGGFSFEPPVLAYQYNTFLKTLHSFGLFGILFGAVFRFDLGSHKSTRRHIATIPILGLIGSLFYGSFGLAAGAAFIFGGIAGYLLLTLTLWATALIKFPTSDQAANPAKKKFVKVKSEKKGDTLEEDFGDIQKAVRAAATA